MTTNQQINDSFVALSASIESFVHIIKSKKLSLMATDEWTVKNVLCHIVFWHENYAANYQALAQHKNPSLPEKMSTINKTGVASLNKYSVKNLVSKLYLANESLYKSIEIEKVPQMTYSKGGRTYKTIDFLEMITRHITSHTKQIQRAK